MMVLNADDSGVVLDFTVKRADGTAYDLTGATLLLKCAPFADKALSIISATAGTCRLTTVASEFGASAKTYDARLRIAAAGGGVYHSSWFQIQVLA